MAFAKSNQKCRSQVAESVKSIMEKIKKTKGEKTSEVNSAKSAVQAPWRKDQVPGQVAKQGFARDTASSWCNSQDGGTGKHKESRRSSKTQHGEFKDSVLKHKAPWSSEGQASKKARSGELQGDACSSRVDCEGRQYKLDTVVVNFANVGATFGKKCLGRDPAKGGLFDWEGVRRCCRFMKNEQKLKVVGVINENFAASDNGSVQRRTLPQDIAKMCESVEDTPRIPGAQHSSADDEMTIKCAYRRNCYFLDNDHYRDWQQQLRNEKMRLWLETHANFLQMRYYFDKGLGTFDLLEGNVPQQMLAPDKGVVPTAPSKKDLWSTPRG
jgi:hypothetical protein